MWQLLMLLMLAPALLRALTPSCQDVHHLSNRTNRSYARLDCYCRAHNDGSKMYLGDLLFLSSHVSRAKKVRNNSNLDHVQVLFKYCQSILLKDINMAAILPKGKITLNINKTSIIRLLKDIRITPKTSLIMELEQSDEFNLKEARIKCLKCDKNAKMDDKFQIVLNKVDQIDLENIRAEIPVRIEVENAKNVLVKESYFEILDTKTFSIQKSNKVQIMHNEFFKVATQAFDINEVSKLSVKWNSFNISSNFTEPRAAFSLNKVEKTTWECNNNNFYCDLDPKTFILPILLLLPLMIILLKLCLCLTCISGLAQKCLLSKEVEQGITVQYKHPLLITPKASILKRENRKNSLESRPELEQGRSYVRISNVVVDNADNDESNESNVGVVRASITLGGAWPKTMTSIKAFTVHHDDTIVSQVDNLEHINEDDHEDNREHVGKRRRRKATPPANFRKRDKKNVDKKKNCKKDNKKPGVSTKAGVTTCPSPPRSPSTGSRPTSGNLSTINMAEDETDLGQTKKRMSQTSLGRYTTV